MNPIERLIEEMCPDGVPFKPLGEIATLVRGRGLPKSKFTETGTGCIHYGQIYTRYGTHTDITYSFTESSYAKTLTQVNPGDLVITNTSENIEDVCKAVAWLGEETIVTGGHATVIKHDLDPKFLSYYTQCPAFQAQKNKLAQGTKVIEVSANNLAKIAVPIPPLAVQREIVAILDKFSRLEAELEAELEARTQQFLANLDLCFDSIDSSFLRPLPSFATIRRGNAMPRKDLSDTGIPAIHYGDIYTRYPTSIDTALAFIDERLSRKLLHISPTDVIVASTSENVEDLGTACVWNGDRTAVIGGHATALSTNQDSLYLAYWFKSSQFQKQKARLAKGTKVIDLGLSQFRSLIVPLPPLSEQNRISRLLHSMDVLISDHLDGIPAEITARRQQYEYYRDRLLTFKELQ